MGKNNNKEEDIKRNLPREVKITSNIQKVQANKAQLILNMCDLESIQMENARQTSWKFPKAEKLLTSLMSTSTIDHKVNNGCSLLKNMSDNDKWDKSQYPDSA